MSPATVTPVRKPRAGDPGGDLDAPWRVIVLNDDHNTFDGVAFALSSVLPGVGFDQGMNCQPDPLERPRRRLVRAQGAGRALLGAAQGPGPDDGPARPPLALVGSGPCCSRSRRRGSSGSASSPGAFIVFALLSAFYFPRRNPDFPGKRLGLYIAVAALFFVGTMAGVIFFASEEEEAHGAEATETHGAETGEEPATTEAAPSTPAGDATAGEAVFASAGCGGCHTLEAAGASGNGRPEPRRREARRGARDRAGDERHGRDALLQGPADEKQIQDVAAYVVRVHAGVATAAIPCRPPGEVSERPKERDWKSRTRRKACRGFKSRPLRCRFNACHESGLRGPDSWVLGTATSEVLVR